MTGRKENPMIFGRKLTGRLEFELGTAILLSAWLTATLCLEANDEEEGIGQSCLLLTNYN